LTIPARAALRQVATELGLQAGPIRSVSGFTKSALTPACPLLGGEAHGLDDNFHAAEFTRSTPDVGAIPCVSGVTKSALTPVCCSDTGLP
jgi:hypothetical protein